MTIEADMFRRMAFEDSIYSSSNDPWKYIDPVTCSLEITTFFVFVYSLSSAWLFTVGGLVNGFFSDLSE